jgi:hypothetical protein
MLGASTGNRVQGYYCATDLAFEELKRYVRIFPLNPVWSVCIEQVETAERRLESLGSVTREVAEEILNEGTYPRNYELYEQALELFEEMDDFTSAVFVILGSRLRGVSEAVNRLHKHANLEAVPLPKGQHSFGGDVGLARHVGNFAKHGDEWGETLNDQQRRTLKALIRIGVATNDPKQRFTYNWVASNCALKLGRQPLLSTSLREIVAKCREAVELVPGDVDQAFAPFESAILAKRTELQPQQRVHASQG